MAATLALQLQGQRCERASVGGLLDTPALLRSVQYRILRNLVVLYSSWHLGIGSVCTRKRRCRNTREKHQNTEWIVNSDILSDGLKLLGTTPEKYLFVSRLNKQLPCYVSYKPDLTATAMNAFTLSWACKGVWYWWFQTDPVNHGTPSWREF